MSESNDLSGVKFTLVETLDEANAFMRWLGERRRILAVDTETEGLLHWRDRIRLCQFGDTQTGWAIPWEGWGGLARQALAEYQEEMVAHNLSFDAKMLRHAGVKLRPAQWHDTMLMAHVNDPRRGVGLKPLSAQLIDSRSAYASRALDEAMSRQGWTFATVPLEFFGYWAYGALDTVLTARLFDVVDPLLSAQDREAYELERRVMWPLIAMEERGCRIDVAYCERTIEQLGGYAAQLETWARGEYGINVGSPKQLAQALIDNGVPLEARTATGAFSTTAAVLRTINHPLADAALRQRRARKLVGSYLENFVEMREDDIIRPQIRQLAARTGRMAITSPALQTLPRGHIVRGAFIPREGRRLYTVDYDAMEMRVLCHFARDSNMQNAILSGDLHTATARLVYGDQTIDRKDPRRQLAKNAGFAKAYGAGVEKFALTAGVTVDEARTFLDGYDETYPGVKEFQRRVEQVANGRKLADGDAWVRTPLGRWHPADPGKEYTLVNYLIQGAASDIFKEAIVRMEQADVAQYMLLPIHDEAILDVPSYEDDPRTEEAIVHEVEKMMTDDRWFVPITVAAEGPFSTWGQKYPYGEFDAFTESESLEELTSDR